MKTYTYETLDGIITIEIDEIWCTYLANEDRYEENQERRHIRSDHKYALGEPISFDTAERTEDWLVFSSLTSYKAVELKIDLEMALKILTPLQKKYFMLNRVLGYSSVEIAKFEGKRQCGIHRSVQQAEKKIRKFFRT